MATTTPNYGWTVPTSTDLVKDGATAIETLGDAIDASLVDLRGGTTGQVLKKASATQMDFEWGTASSGLTLINTTSFSGVSSQSVNDVFSATYKYYKIVINQTSSSVSTFLRLRLRVAGSDDTNNVYAQKLIKYDGGASVGTVSGSNDTSQIITEQGSSTKGADVTIFDPFTAAPTTIVNNALSTTAWLAGGCIHTNSTSFTGFTLFNSSGTITGSVSVFGYNA